MGTKIKITLLSFLLIILSVLGLIFSVSQKINTSDIRKKIQLSLREIYPKSKITVGKIDYSLGSYIRVYVNSLEVKTDSSNTVLLKTNKIITKFPLTQVFTDNGVIHLEFQEGEVSLDSLLNKKFSTPAFFKKNRVDLRFENFETKAFNKSILWQKIILKNLKNNSSTAFELITRKDFILNSKKTRSTIQAIGEVDLVRAIKDKKISTNLVLQFRDSEYVDEKVKLPNLSQKIRIEALDNNSHQIDQSIDLEGVIEGTSSIITNDFIEFDVTRFDYKFKDSDIIKSELNKNKFGLSFNNFDLDIKGKFKFNKNLKVLSSSLEFRSMNKIKTNLINFDLVGKTKNKAFNINLNNKFKDGDVDLNFLGKIEHTGFKIENLRGKIQNINLSRFDIISLFANSSNLEVNLENIFNILEDINITSKNLKVLDESIEVNIVNKKKAPVIIFSDEKKGKVTFSYNARKLKLEAKSLSWKYISKILSNDLPIKAKNLDFEIKKNKRTSFKFVLKNPEVQNKIAEDITNIYKERKLVSKSPKFSLFVLSGFVENDNISIEEMKLTAGKNFKLNLKGIFNLETNKLENLKGSLYDKKILKKKVQIKVIDSNILEDKDNLR